MNKLLKNKAVKRIVCVFVAAFVSVGAFSVSVPCGDVRAESISSMQQKINGLESEKSTLKSKINELQGRVDKQQAYVDTLNSYIATVESKIMTCENLLATYQSEIDDLNREIDKKEEELAENKELFKRRIRSIYMSGSNTSLSLLLGSDQFADYLSMSQFTESLAQYDNSLMEKINLAVDDINKSIKKVEKTKTQQEDVKKQLAVERADLQEKQSEAAGTLSSMNKTKAQLQAEMAKVDSSIASLEKSIDAAYEAARQAAQLADAPKYDGSGFAWPLPGYSMITSPFGNRFDPYYQVYRGHNGIDISGGGVAGKPIIATAAGTVTVAEFNNGGYGNYVVISHGYVNGSLLTSHYGHMMSYAVSVGQHVNQGDVIGYVGTTGASTGYHLHFETRQNNVPVNPFNYVSY